MRDRASPDPTEGVGEVSRLFAKACSESGVPVADVAVLSLVVLAVVMAVGGMHEVIRLDQRFAWLWLPL
jgi:hypothetical protein